MFFNLRLNSLFILEKKRPYVKKKTLSMPKCLFYHSTPTLATWGAQIRVGHQLIMPVAEPYKRLLILGVGVGVIYIKE